MTESVLQDIGRIAGLGGLAFGVFLFLFREVIRKNIFPKLPADHAYQLIRQFMYLTFAIAFTGIAAWTFMTISTSPKTPAAAKLVKPAEDISGAWTAEVHYSWGSTHQESFHFKVDGNVLSGGATYALSPHPITSGVITGRQLSFKTGSLTLMDGKSYQEKHEYQGTLSDEGIDFVLHTDSEYASIPSVTFSAHKKSTDGEGKL